MRQSAIEFLLLLFFVQETALAAEKPAVLIPHMDETRTIVLEANLLRTSKGLPPLRIDPGLCRAADFHAQEMASSTISATAAPNRCSPARPGPEHSGRVTAGRGLRKIFVPVTPTPATRSTVFYSVSRTTRIWSILSCWTSESALPKTRLTAFTGLCYSAGILVSGGKIARILLDFRPVMPSSDAATAATKPTRN